MSELRGGDLIPFGVVCDVFLEPRVNVLNKLKKNGVSLFAINGVEHCKMSELACMEPFSSFGVGLDDFLSIRPIRKYSCVDLFSGGGGLALGLDAAGFDHVLLVDKYAPACATLRLNKPEWNVICSDVCDLDFSDRLGCIDILCGGVPCQSFSYAGGSRGFEDKRGDTFYEFIRLVSQSRPKVCMFENVKGFLSHSGLNAMSLISEVFARHGYRVVESSVYDAMLYSVPQKRERLFVVAVRDDCWFDTLVFRKPAMSKKVYTVGDALEGGDLYFNPVCDSEGAVYPEAKKNIMSLIPEGGNWRDLPDAIAREYLGVAYNTSGGRTGMARRLAMDRVSLTLTCSPAQKKTDRCHPLYDRPLQIREYARIQTFPDDWVFVGSLSAKYRLIGNAVPVNLAKVIGLSLIDLLNQIVSRDL